MTFSDQPKCCELQGQAFIFSAAFRLLCYHTVFANKEFLFLSSVDTRATEAMVSQTFWAHRNEGGFFVCFSYWKKGSLSCWVEAWKPDLRGDMAEYRDVFGSSVQMNGKSLDWSFCNTVGGRRAGASKRAELRSKVQDRTELSQCCPPARRISQLRAVLHSHAKPLSKERSAHTEICGTHLAINIPFWKCCTLFFFQGVPSLVANSGCMCLLTGFRDGKQNKWPRAQLLV